ncbi:MAG: hypothetical protein MRQ07_01965 [Candidatus Midichloria sp.]|nr:hypothetical protein [Candidatus Midichloria sp.]
MLGKVTLGPVNMGQGVVERAVVVVNGALVEVVVLVVASVVLKFTSGQTGHSISGQGVVVPGSAVVVGILGASTKKYRNCSSVIISNNQILLSRVI